MTPNFDTLTKDIISKAIPDKGSEAKRKDYFAYSLKFIDDILIFKISVGPNADKAAPHYPVVSTRKWYKSCGKPKAINYRLELYLETPLGIQEIENIFFECDMFLENNYFLKGKEGDLK